jgi:hypothetical protein
MALHLPMAGMIGKTKEPFRAAFHVDCGILVTPAIRHFQEKDPA